MKKFIAYFVLSFLMLQQLRSQDSLKSGSVTVHKPVYKVRVYITDMESFRTYLTDIRDSSIFVYRKQPAKADPLHKKNIYATSNQEKYAYTVVQSIKVNNQKLRTWTILGD